MTDIQTPKPDTDNNSENSERHESPVRKESKYAILMETSGEECESWYSFIRYNGNEKALRHLDRQVQQVDWHVLDDLSTFDLELEYLVSAQTAKEMTKLDLNHTSHHRKFDGEMKRVDLKFKKKDSNDKKMTRAFDVLGYGQIEDFVSDEDVDNEDLTENEESEDEKKEESSEEDGSDEEDGSEEEKEEPPKRKKGIPPALLASNLPRHAKAKQHRRKK